MQGNFLSPKMPSVFWRVKNTGKPVPPTSFTTRNSANLANLAKLKYGISLGKNAKASNLVNLARIFFRGVQFCLQICMLMSWARTSGVGSDRLGRCLWGM
jgi:hypothetical protein